MHKKNQAFTLIELLVAIAILGILATISMTSLRGVRQSSRDAKRKTDLETIRAALEMYRADCNEYPPTIPVGTSIACNGKIYLKAVPDDPLPSDRDYYYNRPSTNRYYLCSGLENTMTSSVTCGQPSPPSCGALVTCNYQTANP